ncbi:colorectal cancer-associated protein 2 isoform X2 [Acanthopagrus latus]|uniref:colorectal cancer-associated protein 2 isoform X2 n=1 Tax=Acanthopagrus latus TaxID=8177 RepID=UPI00187BE45E|nr:colorectal cancer-associated protein 2 isoform X2 [Acanthopagrus latus]
MGNTAPKCVKRKQLVRKSCGAAFIGTNSTRDKPRVYQGVRVKTTVKELLQRHRAREASSKKVKTITQACLELQDLYASTFPSCLDPPTAIPPADASSCGARAQHVRFASFPCADGSCSIPTQESSFHDIQPQFGDLMLPSNSYSGSSNNTSGGVGSGGYSTSLPPPAALPLPLCHGLSSDADYYGMAPCSSPESLKFCNQVDHNSYSPQDSFSSSSSSCYDSPTRMQSSYHSFPSEHFHYQHCNLQDCYCLPHCWPGQQESFSAPEYAPYYNPTDYPYACPVEENYFKRDLQMGSEMCYNIL